MIRVRRTHLIEAAGAEYDSGKPHNVLGYTESRPRPESREWSEGRGPCVKVFSCSA
jgi:hypothetical protein